MKMKHELCNNILNFDSLNSYKYYFYIIPKKLRVINWSHQSSFNKKQENSHLSINSTKEQGSKTTDVKVEKVSESQTLAHLISSSFRQVTLNRS